MKWPHKTLLGVVLCLLFFLALQFYKDAAIKINAPIETDKIVEIEKSVITGYKNHRISWNIRADYIWAGQNKYIFSADNVHDGTIFDSDGTVVIQNISAKSVKVNSQSKTLSAENNISAFFIKRETKEPTGVVSAEEEKPKNIKIQANYLKYFSENKRTFFYDHVMIEQGKAKVFTDSVEVDNDKNIAFIDSKFTMMYEDFMVSGNQMIIYIDDDYSEVIGNVFGVKEGRPTTNPEVDEREASLRAKNTFLTCDYLKYYSKPNDQHEIDLKGNIRITQDDKSITGLEGYYRSQDETFILSDKVQFNARNLIWALKKSQVQSFKNDDIKKSIQQPITVYADYVLFNSKTKTLQLLGQVRIIQKDKEITCNKMEFIDSQNLLNLSGNVVIIKENQDKLRCEQLSIDIQHETFMANDRIESEFKVKKNKKQNK